jgi:hypothetical protein
VSGVSQVKVFALKTDNGLRLVLLNKSAAVVSQVNTLVSKKPAGLWTQAFALLIWHWPGPFALIKVDELSLDGQCVGSFERGQCICLAATILPIKCQRLVILQYRPCQTNIRPAEIVIREMCDSAATCAAYGRDRQSTRRSQFTHV